MKSWRVPTSAILGIAFALALLAGWGISRDAINSQTTYEQQAKQYAEADREAAYRHAQASCVRLVRTEIRECVHKQYHAAREAERQEYDLEAQRVTSAWTRAMGLAAIVGMVFGILGVGLVWRTFEATRESNEIARETARQQLRAYLGIRDYKITPMDFGLEPGSKTGKGGVSVTMQNFGQTPAIDAWAVISIGFRGWDKKIDRPQRPRKWAFVSKKLPVDVPPSAPYHRAATMPDEIFEYAFDIPVGTVAVYVELKTSFLDVFKRRHEQTTLLYSRGKRYSDCEMLIAEQSRETTTEPEKKA